VARPQDAIAISSLYDEAYRPAKGGDARKCYPFAQFLDPDSVKSIVSSDTIRWFVAEIKNKIIGTCGAVVNIGTPSDMVAECFGLVIDEKWRLQHLGTALFNRLCDSLTVTKDAAVIIAETRTSHPGGWKIVRKCNFLPLGFEPYAHRTPAGSESMLMTGRILPAALTRRKIEDSTSAQVFALSKSVLREWSCTPLARKKSEAVYPLSIRAAVTQLGVLENSASFPLDDRRKHAISLEIYEDQSLREPPDRLKNLPPHKAGIISLCRLEGQDNGGIRYRRKYFLARFDNDLVAYALAVCDVQDRRVRILDLRTTWNGIQGLLIQHILRQGVREIMGGGLAVVVDVRADNVRLHATLKKLGFFPTVYYPSLIAEGEYRIDAVQFTRLYDLDFELTKSSADFKEWPAARDVVSSISG
jgi:hypothetical protein